MKDKHRSKADNDGIQDEGRDTSGQSPQGSSRRPYRRPEVQKRRSVSQATLVTGGGTGGTLAGGAP